MLIGTNRSSSLHTICPYFTMFPIEFPLSVLMRTKTKSSWILDPFCGRGTTNFAARLMGMASVGIDSSPVAAAIAKAKLANSTPQAVASLAQRVLKTTEPTGIPTGQFWKKAFHPRALEDLCRLRTFFIQRCSSDDEIILRALVLGALHGPLTKSEPSYFSNQCPRTYGPKPSYAVRFWKKHGFKAPSLNSLDLITRKATRFLTTCPKKVKGEIIHGDSRSSASFSGDRKYSLIITSPPYYGMRTYIPDQWLRNWFVGGPSEVEYRLGDQEVKHASPYQFADQLRAVWSNVAGVSEKSARLVIRFGGINDRGQDPVQILKQSLARTRWKLTTVKAAGTAEDGKRQANQFSRQIKKPLVEFDAFASLG